MFDAVYELDPVNRDWDSNRLTAADAEPRAVEELRSNLKASLRDRDGNRPGLDATGLRWVDGTPRSALRVPFLDAICPDAYFVYVHREPRETVPSMLEAWGSGGYVTYPSCPGWPGPPWSLPLVPGWRELSGHGTGGDRRRAVDRTTRALLDDLEALPPERWCVADLSAVLDDPRREVERVCAFVEIEAGEDVTLPMRRSATSAQMARRREGRRLARRSSCVATKPIWAGARAAGQARKPAGTRSRRRPILPCAASTRRASRSCSASSPARCWSRPIRPAS